MMICRNCGRELHEEQFELYPMGTRRRICRHCHYLLHTRKGYQKWLLREKARAMMGRLTGQSPK